MNASTADDISRLSRLRGPMTQQQRSRANLSRFHPDHGLTVEEHEKRKVMRAEGRLKFIPKDKVRSAASDKRWGIRRG